MPHNVLQVASEANQPADDGVHNAPKQDARALLGHLNSAYEPSAFGRAVAKTDQIQRLIELINLLDRDTQLGELRDVVRDLCGALNDAVLRTKQNAYEVSAKIGLLTGAMAIISGMPDMGVPQDIAAIQDGAIATAERMVSVERLQKAAGAAIAALEESASRAQHTVSDLSAGLEQLNARADSDRNEVTNLHQRIESTDRASTEALTTLGERAAALRDEVERIHQRLGSVESSTAAEIHSCRLQNSERSAALLNRLEALEQKNQTLTHDTEQMAARLQAAERTIATMTQSQKALSTWQDRIAHVLLEGPQLPAV